MGSNTSNSGNIDSTYTPLASSSQECTNHTLSVERSGSEGEDWPFSVIGQSYQIKSLALQTHAILNMVAKHLKNNSVFT